MAAVRKGRTILRGTRGSRESARQSRMKLAVVGCGYVAEFYGKTLGNYPELKLVGAYDRNERNLQAFCQSLVGVRRYAELASSCLSDPSVELVLNLTNPRSHYEVTKQCIEAGKHVYSEKPLAMDAAAARELVDLAEQTKRVSGLRAMQHAERNGADGLESAQRRRNRPGSSRLCQFR